MKEIFDESAIVPGVPGIILLSHGPLASGMLGTVELVYGDVENVAVFELEEGDNPDEYREHFTRAYDLMPARSVYMIDIFGGSPFNEVMQAFLAGNQDIRAICGMNLGMLVEAITLRGNSDADFLTALEDVGREAVIDVGKRWNNRS